MGTLWCWGLNDEGQLGLGDRARRSAPVQVGRDADWVMVTAGHEHTCALKGTARVRHCWGNNFAGRLGLGTEPAMGSRYQRYLSPTSRGDQGWTTLSAGYDVTCGIMKIVLLVSLRGAACRGENSYGQLGVGSRDNQLTPAIVASGTRWTEVSVGAQFACGLRDGGEVPGMRYCWGDNSTAQLGIEPEWAQLSAAEQATSQRLEPTTVPGDGSWSTLAAGDYHGCGISVNRRAYCWGQTKYGAVGLGEPGPDDGCCVPVPETRLPGTSWAKIYAGPESTCGLTTSGNRLCWGRNNCGQLGLGDRENRYSPTSPGTEPAWDSLTLGWKHGCGIRKTGALFCWGSNEHGQVGSRHLLVGEERTLPVPVE